MLIHHTSLSCVNYQRGEVLVEPPAGEVWGEGPTPPSRRSSTLLHTLSSLFMHIYVYVKYQIRFGPKGERQCSFIFNKGTPLPLTV